jgi:hypothetical protein
MAKEYVWKLPTEHGEKEITCEADGNKYHLYIGDAFIKTVYKNMSGNAEVELTIAGVPCIFVSFSDKPDLVVEGRMLGSGKLYEAEKRENGKNLATFGLIEIFIGIVALIVAVVMLFSSKDAFSGDFTYIVSYLPSFIIPIAFIIFGAIEIYNVNKEK